MNSEGVAGAYGGGGSLEGRDIGWWLIADATHTTSDALRTWVTGALVSSSCLSRVVNRTRSGCSSVNVLFPYSSCRMTKSSLWGAQKAALII